MLPHSVYGYFNNGGALAYIVRIPHTEPATESGTLALPSADRTLGPAVEITTVEPERRHRRHRDARAAGRRREDAPPTFRVDVTENGEHEPVETFSGLTLTKGDRNIETVVNKESTKVKVATKIDVSQARGRPGQPARRQLRHRAGRRRRPSPCPAGRSPVPRPPARASTASSSPRTSRW